MQLVPLETLDLAQLIRPGALVVWGQGGAEPLALTERLMEQRHAIGGVKVFIGASLTATVDPLYLDAVEFTSYCAMGMNRNLAKINELGVLPSHYSELSGQLAELDVLMLQVAEGPSPGTFSFSVAHEYLVPLLDKAKRVIVQINDQAPWTYGERLIMAEDIDFAVRVSRPLPALSGGKVGEVEKSIARRVCALIEDRSTLQLGIGALPEAILAGLSNHQHLGIHSGTIGDGVAELTECGVITNAFKRLDPNVTVAGVMLGGQRVYDFAHHNAQVQFRSTAYTHCLNVISQLDRFVALNSAIEVDLSGQINAEVAGGRYVGAMGGAMDFIHGAHHSHGGLPIIALPSTAIGGTASRIVERLSGPSSTPRADAGIIVTEYGVADLRGRTIKQRRELMLAIAHPEFRDVMDNCIPAPCPVF
ncbi:acetyl-CoA hydrolase/transferase C-terminal domain-containing protein [Pseudomonas fluorescens]|uniref:acetyl-CoA hydrolase/transferase family protein n=1 Tax=Pseudomonas fluorescens TaxID=294 RepID=UPI002ACA2462|nr:acetyl-CoA hydrolase/transferase C-terminal domain-containing protein [Pseudomonas fluorescens]MDZ5431935.1 acetyl-CoA hydrolase/transferase C-terminal domain-containing protein [Pseudomonas fluorescens]